MSQAVTWQTASSVVISLNKARIRIKGNTPCSFLSHESDKDNLHI